MIRHLAGVCEVVEDIGVAVVFYRDVVGIPVEFERGATYAHATLNGVLHFGIWERGAAAVAIFGDGACPGRVPLGFRVGFEVASLAAAVATLRTRGAGVETGLGSAPSGQSVGRVRLPSGALADLLETPWAREIASDARVRVDECSRPAPYSPSV